MTDSTELDGVGRVDGARTPEVAALMESAVKTGQCPFCSPSFEEVNGESKFPIYSTIWNIWHNLSPFEGTSHHVMFAPIRHVQDLSELNQQEWSSLLILLAQVQSKLGIDSFSLLLRSGDRRYNSATVDHLHLHMAVSDAKPIRADDFSDEGADTIDSLKLWLTARLGREPDELEVLEEFDRLRVLLDDYRAYIQGKARPIRAKLSNKVKSQ